MKTGRIVSFDFLRGICIILALHEHFAAYLNFWYTTFFSRHNLIDSQIYFPALKLVKQGPMPIDSITYYMALIFVPWVSHIYLSLAAFNLGKAGAGDSKGQVRARLGRFLALALFFQVENAIVSLEVGSMLSIYPITTWMMSLAILYLVQRYLGIKGIIALFALLLAREPLGIVSAEGSLQVWMQSNLHKGFEYDARLSEFLGSGIVGFLAGYLYFRKSKAWGAWKYRIVAFAIAMAGAGACFGPEFIVQKNDILATEHMLGQSTWGLLRIWGINLAVMTLLLIGHTKGMAVRIPVIQWVGMYSLLVFASHRILFVHFLAPLREFIGLRYFGVPLVNSTLEIYLFIAASIGLSALFKLSRIPETIMKQT